MVHGAKRTNTALSFRNAMQMAIGKFPLKIFCAVQRRFCSVKSERKMMAVDGSERGDNLGDQRAAPTRESCFWC